MKPRIKPLPKTGDASVYWVEINGHGQRLAVSGCMQAVTRKHPLELLAVQIDEMMARMGLMEKVSRLTAPSH